MNKLILCCLVILLGTSCSNSSGDVVKKPITFKKTSLGGCYVYKDKQPGFLRYEEIYGKDSYYGEYYCFKDDSFINGMITYSLSEDYYEKRMEIYDEVYDKALTEYSKTHKNVDDFEFDESLLDEAIDEEEFEYELSQYVYYKGRYSYEKNMIRMVSQYGDNEMDYLDYKDGLFYLGTGDFAFERLHHLSINYSNLITEFTNGEYSEELPEYVFWKVEMKELSDILTFYNLEKDEYIKMTLQEFIEDKMKTVDLDTKKLAQYVTDEYQPQLQKEKKLADELGQLSVEATGDYFITYAWKDKIDFYDYNAEVNASLVINKYGSYVDITTYENDVVNVCQIDFKTDKVAKKPIAPIDEGFQKYYCSEEVLAYKEDTLTSFHNLIDNNDLVLSDLESFVQ